MGRLSVRACAAMSLVMLMTAVVVDLGPISTESPTVEAATAKAAPPLEVSGAPTGEALKPSTVPEDVLLEPPSDAVPVNESLDARLKREQAAAPKPSTVGFDKTKSKEDVAERTAFGTVYDNVDGTSTAVLDSRAVHFDKDGKWEKIDPQVVRVDNE